MAKRVTKKATAQKPKRKRRTKKEMIAAKLAEQKKHAPKKKISIARNKAMCIEHVAAMIKQGAKQSEITHVIKEKFYINDIDIIKKAAFEYLSNNVFKDQIAYYSKYIAELDYLYAMALGVGVKRPVNAKDFVVDYKEARNILAQKETAILAVGQILQMY